MSFFKRLLKVKKSDDDKEFPDKSVAIIGLDSAGKTTIINRLLKSDFNLIRPTFGINIEIYKYRSLEFVVYDIGGQTPLRESLWEKFVKSADGIVFVLDSADTERFQLAKQEFERAMNYNPKVPVLFLSNKIDLEQAASADEIMNLIDFDKLARQQREYNFARCSALTGQYLFESWDWLTLKLSEDQNLPATNVKILGGYVYSLDGTELEKIILGKPKTQFDLNDLFKIGAYELKKFIKQMKHFDHAETLLQAEKRQLLIIKDRKYVLGIIIGEKDPAGRAVQILKKISKTIHRKDKLDEKWKLEELLIDNYPLDIFKEQ